MVAFLMVIGIVALCIILLGVRIFFVKDGKFPNLHIEGNKALGERGIKCASKDTEKLC